jgi:1-phosphofructokinase
MADQAKPRPLPLKPCSAAVFAPSPVLTITIEQAPGDAEIHLHAGGQGFWVARMAARLGADVRLCAPLGGETGVVLQSLLEVDGITLLSVRVDGANGAYVHDRRRGERVEIAQTPSPSLQRHELDDLYGAALTAGLDADVTLLTGPRGEGILPHETFERLSRDLRRNGRFVLADLSGPSLDAALRGGVDLIKVSEAELTDAGLMRDHDLREAARAVRRLREAGAANAMISRGERTAVALLGDRLLGVSGPRFAPLDESGAGDSLFAGVGVGLGSGLTVEEALRVGVAAGALNVTRRGLGTGDPHEISRLAAQVRVGPIELDQASEHAEDGPAAATAS